MANLHRLPAISYLIDWEHWVPESKKNTWSDGLYVLWNLRDD